VTIGDIQATLDDYWNQICERHEQYGHDAERPALKPEELFLSNEQIAEQMTCRARLGFDRHELPDTNETHFNLPVSAAPPVLINTHSEEPASHLKEYIQNFSGRILFAAESTGRREMLTRLLADNQISVRRVDSWHEFLSGEDQLAITVAPLHQGAIVEDHELCVIAEQEMFGPRTTRRRRGRKVRDPEAILNDLSDLTEGSAVVHEDYGIGRYHGLSSLEIDNVATEFLSLEYADGDRLHVPISSLHLISRYTGPSPDTAPLHKLGSGQWEKIRRKAAEKIRDVAAELLDIYATRAARGGTSSKLDPLDYERFAAGFPFQPTDDQARAIEDTLDDLTTSSSMDRLVCGDVGFGKTEVALRAAYTVATDGRQVAILAPTTLLAQQHYQTFCDRFADWPVNIEVLSRFRGNKESRKTIGGLADGSVDIVIGTHKLLQEDIRFSDLGLLIIDEEHRFGVRQKERIKSLRSEVDILTLTATPIPRTLNMAIGGLRELSLITTPPESRLSIKTFVSQWDENLLREVIQRELKRGGQVYFVHNRVQDIEQLAAKVAEVAPTAGIRIAHGQMRERDLEQVMLDFYHRRFHILVCTSIIESGLDIPTANTIVINRADRFGLAQLHQLRGRVGRSHHKAYAYLIAPQRHLMTADACKRLDAIESMEDLGAGFILATHDLEIRGAGEILGDEQTGQIQQIGFSLYTELLGRAVTAIRSGATPELDERMHQGPEINLRLPALLPDNYMPDVHLRLTHYKRIANAGTRAVLRDLQVELIDRFGLLPDATKNLFRQTEIKLLATTLGIKKIDAYSAGGYIEFASDTAVNPEYLVQLLQLESGSYTLDAQQRLRFTAEMESVESRFEFVEQLVDDLARNTNDAQLAETA
ncbi:MAG: transcription-repair coupling factor, partial [Gammaproteobacteria bacterium]